ncbi:ADP-ribose glycohydrolase MACROD1-like [Astyanax mexicanus]|uniref:ADP-ribose glycohydrolase MACROD1-like n=1 Tax=Astyanax mexicanus TaxID=7994 RepID=UPI0020CAC896|nr:ADP-ribose glycohydrolase MACROD1-like [Astyanax mexicanus]
MAFQLSKLTAPRCLKVSHTIIKNYWRGEGPLNTASLLNSSRRGINTVQRLEKCSASSTASKSVEWPSFRPWKRGGKFSRPALVLFGLSAAAVASSSVHSSALCAMASHSELHSEDSDWKKVKKELLSMSLEERRKKYKNYISLDDIPIWSHSDASSPDETHEINKKISLFRGDITKLEIDAIANAGKDNAHKFWGGTFFMYTYLLVHLFKNERGGGKRVKNMSSTSIRLVNYTKTVFCDVCWHIT